MSQKANADRFNARYPVGTPVAYWTFVREGLPTGIAPTRSEAWVLGGHTAVVRIEGVSSCIALSHVKVATP